MNKKKKNAKSGLTVTIIATVDGQTDVAYSTYTQSTDLIISPANSKFESGLTATVAATVDGHTYEYVAYSTYTQSTSTDVQYLYTLDINRCTVLIHNRQI